jgi:hypothetical protein
VLSRDADAPQYFASSGFSGVQHMEEVDALVSYTDDVFFDDIDPRVMSMFDLHAPDSAPTPCDDLDHQVKAISSASVGLLDSNEAWVMYFHEKRKY